MNSSHIPASSAAMPYRAVLFDLDGTLLDTAEGVLSSTRYTIEKMDLDMVSTEVLRTFIGPPIKLALMQAYGLSDEEASRATEIFRNQYKYHDLLKAAPYDGILSLLSRLKRAGYLVGVSTLKREDYAITLLNHYHISDHCDIIHGSDFASKMTKADIVRRCLEELSLSPREAVLVGDTASDGKGSKETGVDLIAVTYGFGPDSAEKWSPFEPVFVANSAADIGRFLLLPDKR